MLGETVPVPLLAWTSTDVPTTTLLYWSRTSTTNGLASAVPVLLAPLPLPVAVPEAGLELPVLAVSAVLCLLPIFMTSSAGGHGGAARRDPAAGPAYGRQQAYPDAPAGPV